MTDATDVTTPAILLRSSLSAQFEAASALSLAAAQLPDLPHDGAQILTHVDLRSGAMAIGGVVEIRDWRGAALVMRAAEGHWSVTGQVTWTFKP